MCGIAGFTFPRGAPASERDFRADRLRRMTASLRHRGPDGQRAILLDGIALGHARLAIVDLVGGAQPMRDPASGVTVVFNGEIFNHLELRDRFREHHFRTRSDTEVILAGYLALGISCVREFNGQFAFALWDPRSHELWLARDRVGIAPLFYSLAGGQMAFASEAKALFAGGWAPAVLDPAGVKQTVQLWTPVAPRTLFAGVHALPPRSVARFANGQLEVERYWDLDLDQDRQEPIELDRAIDGVGERLEDSVRLRLRADVPVAAYLSGGLDSSVVCAIAQRALGGTLSTFSVRFPQGPYDERRYQDDVADRLGTRHVAAEITEREIGALLPAVVEHAEQVLLRSAPAPLLRLSASVQQHGTRVVLTGEGSDEIFLGYDLYKETKVRQFWGRSPASAWRAAHVGRLHTAVPRSPVRTELLREFYGVGLDRLDAVEFSHLIRWGASGRVTRFFSKEFSARTDGEDPIESLVRSLPPRVHGWRPLARAQYIEMETLLSGYLLAAQGDRMLMANAVEGRFPFLDHRLIEYAARLPDKLKLRRLCEKYVLREYARRWLPPHVLERPKFPYRAPVAGALVGASAPEWSAEAFAPESVRALGVFDPEKVRRLVTKLEAAPGAATEADGMALMAIASTQLLGRALGRPRPMARSELAAVEMMR
jgi:asparagine synthase (glutamine-hydrolysing)